MIHHRKRGLVAIHGLIVLVGQLLLFPAFLFAGELRAHSGPMPYNLLALYFVSIVVSGLVAFRAYEEFADRLPHFGLFDSIALANRQAGLIGVGFVAVAFVARDDTTDRLFLVILVAVAWVMGFLLNYYLPPLLGRTVFRGSHSLTTLVVGTPRAALKLNDWLKRHELIGFNCVGLVTSETRSDTPIPYGLPVIGETSRLDELIQKLDVSQLIVLESTGSREWLSGIVALAIDRGCRVLVHNTWEESFDRPLALVREGEHTFFVFQEEPLENPLNRTMKRALDLFLAIPVCLVVLPPLALVCAVAQRLQSPGPLLYRQQRCGRRSRRFSIFKFRSMHLSGARRDESRQAVRGDPRVFPFGAILRRFSLDELPQFINVLRGEMSVVGPRPHLVEHDELFARETRFYRTRFFVKPGITGLAQVKGFRGEITDPTVLHERIRWDLAYIRSWSLWLDLLIVARTARHLVAPPSSAY